MGLRSFVLLLLTCSAAAQSSVDSLRWLAGCWVLVRPNGAVVSEQWMGPSGGVMLGMSRTVEGGKTVEFEFTRIEPTADGSLRFVALPSGQEQAPFALEALAPDSAVFHNPDHDFPQRIIYRRIGTDSVHARIEGTIDGKARSIGFPYRRVICP